MLLQTFDTKATLIDLFTPQHEEDQITSNKKRRKIKINLEVTI